MWASWSVDCGCSVQVLYVYKKNFLGSVRVAVLLGVDCLESPNMGLSLTGLRSGCLCVLKLCKHAELCSALYNMYWFFLFLFRKPRVFLSSVDTKAGLFPRITPGEPLGPGHYCWKHLNSPDLPFPSQNPTRSTILYWSCFCPTEVPVYPADPAVTSETRKLGNTKKSPL